MNNEGMLELESINIKELVEEIKKRAQEASNEEELKIYFGEIFNPILRAWGIKPAYERYSSGVRCIVSGVRKDALYGTVILEFKAPGKFQSRREFEKAKEQVKKYIKAEAKDPKYYGRYFGVVFDGYHIGFIRHRKGEWEEQEEPLEVNPQTICRLLEAIRGLKRKPIDPTLLLEDFGPKAIITKKAIQVLYKALVNSKTQRTQMLFEDWKRVFSQICSYSPDKLKGLAKYYGFPESVDAERLTFAIHTYYTILMKLLTSEIITLFADSLIGSYLKRLEEAYLRSKDELLEELKNLEEGGIFAELGIKNFLEADYFAWYLDEWNDEIAGLIYEIVKKLLDYEPATVELSPERIRDLFKRLYQNLVPRDIRHKLGEYFTPDWLAELLLDEVGYDGNPDKKVLDPACGSGTFLVLVIKRIKEYAEKHFIDKRTLLTKIVKNVQGIDLNPLAVLAAKANYIITLADLLRYRPREGIEIPIYLADSIAVGRRTTLGGEEVYLKTSEGEFRIHYEILNKGLLSRILEDIESCIRNKYSKEEFKKFICNKYELSTNSLESITNLYQKLLSLEEKGRNRIWTRILKNSFAPLLIGKFDYVVGNPPWINWENLPEFYREQTKGLWEWYGLTKKTKGVGLGKVKRDMAMLFVAKCLDRFTKENGRLAFLIPFTVYKTQAGAGFRDFLAKGFWRSGKTNCPCKVLKIHDLVTLYPFEGAVNRTSLIIIEKSGKTKFPIPCIIWHNPRSKGIDQEAELEEVKKITKRFNLVFIPVERNKPESPWMQITKKAYEGIKKIIGKNPWYKAHAGVYTGADAVFWVSCLEKNPEYVLIQNIGKTTKSNIKIVRKIVEKEVIYPLVRGKDVKRWFLKPEGWIILPIDRDGKILSEDALKIKYPHTYDYFRSFYDILEKRSAYRQLFRKSGKPPYSVLNSKNAIAQYKVVWKEIAGGITGKAVSFSAAVAEPVIDDYFGRKPIVISHTVISVPLSNDQEAHYLCGILNSSIILLGIASYTYELRQETHILNYIKITKFDPKNPIHRRLSDLSKRAHEIAKKIYEEGRKELEENLKRIEEEIDKTVAKLYGITDEELKEIKKCLMILKEGEIPEEEEEEDEEDQSIILPKRDIEIKVKPLLIHENTLSELTISIQNNTNKYVKNAKLKVDLESRVLLMQMIEELRPGERVSFKFLVPKLRCGEYELEIELSSRIARIKETRKLFVKKEKTKRVKTSFEEELDKLLGG